MTGEEIREMVKKSLIAAYGLEDIDRIAIAAACNAIYNSGVSQGRLEGLLTVKGLYAVPEGQNGGG